MHHVDAWIIGKVTFLYFKKMNTAIHLTSFQQHGVLVLNPLLLCSLADQNTALEGERKQHGFRVSTWIGLPVWQCDIHCGSLNAMWHLRNPQRILYVNILELFQEGLKGNSTCWDWFHGIRTRKAAWGNIKDMSWSRLPGDSLQDAE